MKNNYLNVFLISGSGIIGGLINYSYHPIMLQYLSLNEFGKFGSLVGIFNILGILVAGLSLFLTKEIAKNISNKNKVKHIFIESIKILGIIGIIFYILYLLITPIISNFLGIEKGLIYIIGISIILSFFGASTGSSLVGLKKFNFIGINNILNPVLKLGIGFILIYLGFNLYGAISGFILSSFLCFLISFTYITNNLKKYNNHGNTKELLKDFNKNKLSIINFFLVSLFFSFLMNIDLIFAQNIFPGKLAGIYAGLSVLGKFLIFLLMSIETVYYGQIMEHPKKTVPKHLIINPIVIIILTGLLALFINYAIGGFILNIIKPDLAPYTYIYLLILTYYFFLSFISFFSKILIGWGKYMVNYLLFFTCAAITVSIYILGKASLESFIWCFLFSILIGAILIGGLFLHTYHKSHNS